LNPKPQLSSKVSKDSDYSLISNKNFSKILPSNSLDPGPGEVGQGGQKVLDLWCHSQKIRTPTKKMELQSGTKQWLMRKIKVRKFRTLAVAANVLSMSYGLKNAVIYLAKEA